MLLISTFLIVQTGKTKIQVISRIKKLILTRHSCFRQSKDFSFKIFLDSINFKTLLLAAKFFKKERHFKKKNLEWSELKFIQTCWPPKVIKQQTIQYMMLLVGYPDLNHMQHPSFANSCFLSLRKILLNKKEHCLALYLILISTSYLYLIPISSLYLHGLTLYLEPYICIAFHSCIIQL